MVHNLTLALLGILSPKESEQEKNRSNVSAKRIFIIDQSFEMDAAGFVFEFEERLRVLNIDVLEFRNLDEAFLVWDRMMHLLARPRATATSRAASIPRASRSATGSGYSSASRSAALRTRPKARASHAIAKGKRARSAD